jgi:4-carboxymuconolactone decarboxylase
VAVAKEIFARRGIVSDQPASGELLPIDEAAEGQRAARVEQDAGSVAPGGECSKDLEVFLNQTTNRW